MTPDDLPIHSADEDSTKSPGTNPPSGKDDGSRIGPEAEGRGGAEETADDEPLEQVRRQETSKGHQGE